MKSRILFPRNIQLCLDIINVVNGNNSDESNENERIATCSLFKKKKSEQRVFYSWTKSDQKALPTEHGSESNLLVSFFFRSDFFLRLISRRTQAPPMSRDGGGSRVALTRLENGTRAREEGKIRFAKNLIKSLGGV